MTLALSIQQPWAWLIIRPDVPDPIARDALLARGEIKDVENRTWATTVRGWIDIHAGKTFDREAYDWVRRAFPHIPLPQPEQFQRGGIIGRACLADCVRQSHSPWFVGPYGFIWADAVPTDFRPCRGRLGFFHPEVAPC